MGMRRDVHLVVLFSVVAGFVTIIVLSVAVFSKHWITVGYDRETLQLKVASNLSQYVSEAQPNFVILKRRYQDFDTNTSKPSDTLYIYDEYGGVWSLCDTLAASERLLLFGSGKGACIDYLTGIQHIKTELSKLPDDNSRKDLLRMVNTAASCFIMSLIVLVGALTTGSIGLIMKQVLSCMVTAVFFFIAAFYTTMGVAIMHHRITFENSCVSITQTIPPEVCEARQVTSSWSLVMGWLTIVLCFISFALWTYLSRLMRIEKMQ